MADTAIAELPCSEKQVGPSAMDVLNGSGDEGGKGSTETTEERTASERRLFCQAASLSTAIMSGVMTSFIAER